MLLTRPNKTARRAFGAMIIVFGLLSSGSALAECQPGQMQEANLAYQSAVEFLNSQQWDQAISRMQSIVTFCPEHVEATRGLGTAYLGKEDYPAAVEWFDKTIALRGDNVQAGDYANLAKAYTKLKKYKEARAEYMKAEMLAPDDCGVLFNLGVLHSAAGYQTQSVDVLQHLLDLDQCQRAHAPALKQIAKSASKAAEQQKRAGNNTKAAYYTDLANQYGGQAGGSTTMSVVRQKMQAGDYNGAAELLQGMLAQNPDQPNATLTLARALDAAGRRNESIDAYKRYLELNPNNTTEWGTMVQVLVEAGRTAEAKSTAAAAYQAHSSQGRQAVAPILYSWGLALEQDGDYDEARDKFADCAASGHAKFAASARDQVQRMDDLMALEVAKQKKAAQGG